MTYSISQARKLRDKRQKDMADYLHIHVQTYRKIEKNPELATIKQAKMISEYLNMPYDNINFFNSYLYFK